MTPKFGATCSFRRRNCGDFATIALMDEQTSCMQRRRGNRVGMYKFEGLSASISAAQAIDLREFSRATVDLYGYFSYYYSYLYMIRFN